MMASANQTDYSIFEPPANPGKPLCFFAGMSMDPGNGNWHVHSHRGLELGIVVHGQLEIRIGRHLSRRGRGDVWLYGMWEPHGWRQIGPRLELVVLTFLPQTVEDTGCLDSYWLRMFVSPFEDRPNPSSARVRKRILAMGCDLRSEALGRQPLRHRKYLLTLLELLFELSREWHLEAGADDSHRFGRPLERLMPALAMAHSITDRRVTAQEAARVCNLSISRFEHLFRDIIGASFAQFAARARVGSVANKLLTTDLTLKTIGQQAGFVDASHLHRVFRRYCGCAPGQFRKHGQLSRDSALALAADSLLIRTDSSEESASPGWR